MKNYLLLLVLSLALGTSFAWAMNYSRYGHREAYFGEIDIAGNVHADNVMENLNSGLSTTRPIAELEGEATHDFGAMAPHSEGKHEFVIKNTGNEPLKLQLGATTCKCTLGNLGDESLAPGESTSVTMEWKVQSDSDRFKQSAELRTNDPQMPAIRLVVKGLVISKMEFDPKSVTFGEVPAGEGFDFATKMYSYLENDLQIVKVKFGSKGMTELAESTVEPFELTDDDGVHKRARQGFRIYVKVGSGMRQGPLSTNMIVTFNKLDDDGKVIETNADISEGIYSTNVQVAGRIVGPLSMIESAKLRQTESGGYIWDLGRIPAEAPESALRVKAFVALKGNEQKDTNLSVERSSPDNIISAEIGEPVGRGSMRLFPLTVTFSPQEELVDLLGKNSKDFGIVLIQSDNPKVPRMRVAVKVAIEPRP